MLRFRFIFRKRPSACWMKSDQIIRRLKFGALRHSGGPLTKPLFAEAEDPPMRFWCSTFGIWIHGESPHCYEKLQLNRIIQRIIIWYRFKLGGRKILNVSLKTFASAIATRFSPFFSFIKFSKFWWSQNLVEIRSGFRRFLCIKKWSWSQTSSAQNPPTNRPASVSQTLGGLTVLKADWLLEKHGVPKSSGELDCSGL